MNSKYTVLILGALLCTIPAVVCFWFGGFNEKPAGIVKTPSQGKIVQQTTSNTVTLTLPKALKRGDDEFQMTIKPLTPAAKSVQIEMNMTMGKDTMSAPIALIPMKTPGSYRVKATLMMGGDWEMNIHPDKNTPDIKIPLFVGA